MRSRWFNIIVLLALLIGVLPQPVLAASEASPAAAPVSQDKPDIEVEPGLLVQLMAGQTAGYLIYFREKPDLSPAYEMDWIERGRFVANTLSQAADRSQAGVRAYLDAQGVSYKSFWIENVISVQSSNRTVFNGLLGFSEIQTLRQRRTLGLVEPQRVTAPLAPQAIEPNITHVGADQVWDMGYTGAGIVVANVDTGVRYSHQALVGHYRGNEGGGVFDHNYNWWDPYGDHPTAPGDDNGHGSHTMGTMVGDDGGANQIGMAPGAKWMACRACSTSSCSDTALLECAQFYAAPWDLNKANANADYRPNVVNNSWGDCSTAYDPWYQDVVNAWHAAGIYPVFSNGNASNCGYSEPPGLNTVGNPARYGNVTGVGSSGRDNGEYASHSNWGPTDNPDTVNPTTGWEDLKPQVIAPGVNIRSSVNSGDTAYQGGWSGTSMSAPHVTGLIALMWEAAPCLIGDYASTETIIEDTATPIPYDDGTGGGEHVPNYASGWGEINAVAAVQEAAGYCGDSAIVGRVTDASNSVALPSVTIVATSADATRRTTTNAQGDYVLTVFSDTYTLRASRYGYQTAVVPNVIATTGVTTTRNIQLTPAATYEVSGQVTDAATGWPLYAHITVSGDPVDPLPPSDAVWTDPATGRYSLMLAEGVTYTLEATAWVPGYGVGTAVVAPLTQDATANFALVANMSTCAAPGYYITGGMITDFEDDSFPPPGWTVTKSGNCEWEGGSGDNPTGGDGNFALADSDACGSSETMDTYLISPVFNASALSKVILSFAYDFQVYASGELAAVDVSRNGGATWTNVVNWTAEHAGPATFTQDVSAALAGAAQARVRFHYRANYGWWWALDHIVLGNPVCNAPTSGGLVVGNVYDANYPTVALTGAKVVNSAGSETIAVATADPAVDDAFYTLYAPAGAQLFTATFNGYGPDTANLTIAGGTVEQDFQLPAGMLSVAPPTGVSVSVELGYATASSAVLSNDGSAAAAYELKEADKGYAPIGVNGGYIETLPMPAAVSAPESFVRNGNAKATMASRAPYIYHGPMADAAILVYADDDQHDPTYVETALQNLGLTYTFYGYDASGANLDAFMAAYESGEWDMVILAEDSWGKTNGSDYDLVLSHIEAGGSAIVHSWIVGYGAAQQNHPLWAAMGASYAGWLTSPSSLYWWDDSHALFDDVPEFADLTNLGYLAYGARMNVLGDPDTGLGGFTPDPSSGNAGVIIGAGEKTIYKGLTDNLNDGDLDGDSMMDAAEWWANAVDYLLNPGAGDVPWLSESPTVGTLAAGGDKTVALNFDAGYVDQPGSYYAQIKVDSDTPYDAVVLPVTMTVTPPNSWGKLTGTVTGLGACDAAPAPLAEATVVVESAVTGQVWTLATDDNGVYVLWLDQAQSPLTVAVTAPDYSGEASGVVVRQRQTTTQNFDLRLQLPCLSYNPADFDVTLVMGTNTVEPLTLSNTGAGAADFELLEIGGGAIPMQAIARHAGVQSRAVELSLAHSQETPKTTGPWMPMGAIELFVDDGTAEDSIGLTAGGQFIWLNRFTPNAADFPFHLDQVSIIFPTTVDVGDEMQLVFWQDADGDPSNGAVFVYAENVAVLENDLATWNDYQLATSPVFYGPGDVLVGVVNRGAPDHPAAIDQNGGSEGRSWVGIYSGDPPDPPTLPPDADFLIIDDAGLAGNWTLRASGATGTGGGAGGAIPWLSENPVSETIAADSQLAVDLTFDAGVPETMQPGTFYGSLKVDSNAANAVTNIPVTLTVTPPATWGKVAGTVTGLAYCDLGSPAPLEGVTVTIQSKTGLEWTLMTDVSGTYQLWLDVIHGPLTITVASAAHLPQTFTNVPVVTNGGVTTRNAMLRLAQPCLSTAPTSLHLTFPLGMSGTLPLNVVNDGAVNATFSIGEYGGGYLIASTSHVRPHTAPATHRVTIGDSNFSTNPKPHSAPAAAPQFVRTAKSLDEQTLTHSASQTIVDGNSVACNNGSAHTDNSYLRVFDLEAFDIDADFSILSVDMGIETASGGSGEQPVTVNLYTLEGDLEWANMTLIGTADAVVDDQTLSHIDIPVTGVAPAGSVLVVEFFTPDGNTDGNILFVGSNDSGQTAPSYIAAATCGATEPTDLAALGFGDMHIVMNVTGNVEDAVDVLWLSEVPTRGVVLADNQTPVAVTMDSAYVEFPGDYYGVLKVRHSDSNRPTIAVPVTMTVTPPPTWGKVMGTVRSLGYCDVNPVPVVGLDVLIEGSDGMTWTVTTNVSGTYGLWLDQSHGPVTITVEAPDHEKGEAFARPVTAGTTTVTDFDLRVLAPCVTADPTALHVTLDLGAATSDQLDLANTGAADTDWALAEVNLGDATVTSPVTVTLFSESFEGTFPPTGWSTVDLAGDGNVWDRNDNLGTDNYTNGSGYAAAADSDAVCSGSWDTVLLSPPLDLTSAAAPVLTYQSAFEDFNGAGDAWLDVSTDSGATWTNLTYWTEDRIGTFEVINLAAYAGETIILRWHYSDNDDGCAWYWHIDDVMVLDVDQVTWLSESPASGALVADTGAQAVTVGFAASVVDQPGDYLAELELLSDDAESPMVLPVTMTVNPPASWGQVAGVVSTLGHCDAALAPLAGAQVVILTGATPVVTLTTGAAGAYSYWLPNGTYTVTATAADHSVGSVSVVVVAQTVATQNFNLTWFGPCVTSIAPSAMEVTLAMGQDFTLPLTITNAGAGASVYQMRELPGGFESTQMRREPTLSGSPERLGATKPAAGPRPAPVLMAGDVVADGSFEAGPDGGIWNEYSLNFGTPICDVASCGTGKGTGPRTGVYWVWFGGVADYEEGSMDQDVVIPVGAKYLIFWVEQTVCDSADDYLEVTLDGNSLFFTDGGDSACGVVGYRQIVIDIEAFADGDSHNLMFASETSATNGGVGNFFVDDVSIVSGIPWLSEVPESGSVAADSTDVVSVVFDAGVSEVSQPGTYSGMLVVNNNDPVLAEFAIPVTMHVTLPDTYGRLTGVVTGLGPCDDPLTAAPLAEAEVIVTSATGSWTQLTDETGAYSLWLDEGNTPVTITVSADGYLPTTATNVAVMAGSATTTNLALSPDVPCLSVTPAAQVTLAMGVSTTLPVNVNNTGSVTVNWTLAERDNGFDMLSLMAGGGPDAFGYTFADSAESDGPEHEWVEISATGTPITGLTDDSSAGPFNIGFDFNYYGTDYTQFYVGSNGLLTFGSGSTALSNQNLPNTTTPNNLIALMWDDLYPNYTSGGVYYQSFAVCPYGGGQPCAILEFQNWAHCCSATNSSGTWEAILFGNGSILLQYADTGSESGSSATSGIENSDGTIGLTYVYETATMVDGSSVCFAYPDMPTDCTRGGVPWLAENVTSGATGPGASAPLTLTFDASVPEVTQPGDYLAWLQFTDSAFDVEWLSPVTMTVQAPASWGKIEGLVTGGTYCDASSTPMEDAVVFIEGQMGMTWTLETAADGTYGVWFDAMYGPITVTISNEAGYEALTFPNLAVTAGNVTVQNAHLALMRPCVSASPLSMSYAVPMGTSTTVALNLTNLGAGASSYEVREFNRGFTPLGVMAVGGPDAFGYQYADSNGGAAEFPTYDFVDISTIGAPLTLGDNNFAEVNIGFNFKFYGSNVVTPHLYDSLFVNSNGFLSFDAGSTDLSPDATLPDPTLPNNLIAIAWDDLAPGANGVAYTQSFAQCPYNPSGEMMDACFIVQYDNFIHADGTPAGTFEAILFRSGNVLMQYETMVAPAATTGLEAPYGLDGLTYTPALADELAVCFAYPGEWTNCQTTQVPWLEVGAFQGTLPARDDLTLDVTFNAGVDEISSPGTYMASLIVYTEDPMTPVIEIPVTMTVAMPASVGKLSGTVYAWNQCDVVSTTLANALLSIKTSDGQAWGIHTDANGAYSIWLPAGEVATVVGSANGYAETTMEETISSGVMPARNIALRAALPCINTTPGSYDVAMPADRIVTRTLAIQNTGAADFDFSNIAGSSLWLSVDPKVGSVPAAGSANVTLTFNSTGLTAGDVYSTVLEIAHLNPAIGRLFVRPVRLTVTAAPTVTVDVVKTSVPSLYVLPGGSITYTVVLTNSYDLPLTLTATDAIPANTAYKPGTVSGGAAYVETPAPQILWNGSLDAGEATSFSFSVQVGAGVPTNTVISNMVSVEAAGLTFTATKTLVVSEEEEPPVEVEVTKTSVPGTYVLPGGLITYTVSFTNRYIQPLSLAATDVVPANTTYVVGSVTGGATYVATPTPSVVWNGTLNPNATATFSFAVQVGAGVPTDTQIINTVAVVAAGQTFTATKTVTVSTQVEPTNVVYLPLVMRSYSATP